MCWDSNSVIIHISLFFNLQTKQIKAVELELERLTEEMSQYGVRKFVMLIN